MPRLWQCEVVKNGTSKEIQILYHKTCCKYYNLKTKTKFSSTNKDIQTWNKFVECMVDEHSVRKATFKCGIQ